MFDMLSGQYKNLASKGRYGDTMLAHVNPEEASLLQSMGGAGTINPNTGLPEFYMYSGSNFGVGFGLPAPEPDPLPVLAQVFDPNAFADIADKLDTITVPQEGGSYRGGARPAYEKVNSEFDQYADRELFASFRGGVPAVTGYTVPTDKTFQDKPLVAKYDAKGNFVTLMVDPQNALTPDPSRPNILATPTFNKSGGITNYGVYDANEQGGGGFGDFLGELISDFGPMIALGLGANLLGPAIAGAGAAGGAAGGTLAGMGTGAAGAAATAAATGIPLAALTAGGATTAGLAAGGGSAGGLAGFGTGAAGVNATAAATGLTPAALGVTGLTAAIPTPSVPTPSAPTPASTSPVTPAISSGSPMAGVTPSAVPAAVTNAATAAATTLPNLSSLGGVGTAIMDFAKANPSIAGSLLGAVTSAIGGANAPKEQTTTSSIDPQIKAEYLANLERAKTTAAGLEARQIAQPGQLYNDAESKLYNLGMTPFGEADIAKFFNPYQEQVVQGALGDIERTRLMQEQANRDQATRARAFGGSRQAVVSGMTNEAALRQAANTSAQLRSAGYTQAANLGLQARPMDMTGLQTSLGLGTTRTALEQARLDALRNLGTERLGITSAALGMNIPNLGGSSSQPLYNNTAGNLLSGGLTGAYIGSLLQPKTT